MTSPAKARAPPVAACWYSNGSVNCSSMVGSADNDTAVVVGARGNDLEIAALCCRDKGLGEVKASSDCGWQSNSSIESSFVMAVREMSSGLENGSWKGDLSNGVRYY